MKRSSERILTTHVGRLQRPEALTQAMEADPRGQPTDPAFLSLLTKSVSDIVREQSDAGVDVVCDGEFGKLSWNTYINGRLGGHELIEKRAGEDNRPSRDAIIFSDFYKDLKSRGSNFYYRSPGRHEPEGMRWACTGPVTYVGQETLKRDLDNLKAAVAEVDVADVFIPATSPIRPHTNVYYGSDEEYYEAVGEAMRTEYNAIVDAGFIVQIDDPFLPSLWDSDAVAPRIDNYRKHANAAVDIVNHALRGIPEDRVRYHICWGAWHGPHSQDIPLKDLVDILLRVKAGGYAFEAANARHEHEWQVWRDVKLPAGKVLIPGIVAHATNTIEHPELVAWRIRNFASVAGRENVIAGTDCGLGYRVHPDIAWGKLKTLAEGARLASAELW